MGSEMCIRDRPLCCLRDLHTVELRTTALVEGQQSKTFTVHLERVARATTVTDVLETLLKQANLLQDLVPLDPDTAASRHVRG